MIVQDILAALSYGELSNLSLSGEGSGTIVEAKRPLILAHINEAMLRLYSRFILKENSLILETQEGVTTYKLSSRYAQTNPAPILGDVLFIQDNVDKPFLDDVIKVMRVMTVNGLDLPINDQENIYSVFTPQPDAIQVPNPLPDSTLGVVYQAKHPLLVHTALSDEVDLPIVLKGALTAYVAYKVYSSMNGQENAVKAAEHMAMYESICGDVLDYDLVSSSSSTTNVKFHARGFV